MQRISTSNLAKAVKQYERSHNMDIRRLRHRMSKDYEQPEKDKNQDIFLSGDDKH